MQHFSLVSKSFIYRPMHNRVAAQ